MPLDYSGCTTVSSWRSGRPVQWSVTKALRARLRHLAALFLILASLALGTMLVVGDLDNLCDDDGFVIAGNLSRHDLRLTPVAGVARCGAEPRAPLRELILFRLLGDRLAVLELPDGDQLPAGEWSKLHYDVGLLPLSTVGVVVRGAGIEGWVEGSRFEVTDLDTTRPLPPKVARLMARGDAGTRRALWFGLAGVTILPFVVGAAGIALLVRRPRVEISGARRPRSRSPSLPRRPCRRPASP